MSDPAVLPFSSYFDDYLAALSPAAAAAGDVVPMLDQSAGTVRAFQLDEFTLLRARVEALEGRFLSGTGQPEGVVNAAPGTLYADIATTAGAWLWIKTGGVSTTNWRVVAGDTGWRVVLAWDAAGNWTQGAGFGTTQVVPRPGNPGWVRIRRVGGLVLANVSNISTDLDGVPNGTFANLYGLPYGLRAVGSAGGALGTYQPVNPNVQLIGTTTQLALQFTGGVSGNSAVAAWGTQAIWAANPAEPWPTALPGIAG